MHMTLCSSATARVNTQCSRESHFTYSYATIYSDKPLMKLRPAIRRASRATLVTSLRFYEEENSRNENAASWEIAGTENPLCLLRVLRCSLEGLRRLVERWLQF